MSYDVISIGSATVDFFVTSDQVGVRSGLFAAHRGFWLPAGAKLEIKQSLVQSGGGATNSAVSFARLGLHVACVALLGRDYFGKLVLGELAKEKVVTGLLADKPYEKTDFSFILVAQDGTRTVLVNRGDTKLTAKDVDFDRIRRGKWLYISSLEGNISLLAKLIKGAKKYHQKIALNPGNRELAQKQQLLGLLPLVEVLILNREEAENLLEEKFDTASFWEKVAKLETNIITITNGREAIRVWHAGECISWPVTNITPVDETGAGDSFGSAFVAGLVHEMTIPQALAWGVANSASVVAFFGAKTGLLRLKTLKQAVGV